MSQDDLAALARLAASALERWGLEGSKLTLLNHRENAVYRVDAADSERFVLRVHRRGYQSIASVRSELAWLDALREAGIETPMAVAAGDAECVQEVGHADVAGPHVCDLIRWVEGNPLDASNAVEAFRLLGGLNAKLHAQAQGWTPPHGFVRQRWDAPGMLGEDAVWGCYRDLACLDDMQRDVLNRVRNIILGQLSEYGDAPDRFGLIHADLVLDNVLVHEGKPRIIDFDDSGYGWFMYDPATLLIQHVDRPYFADAYAAWVAGYRAERSLTDEHLAVLPALIMARRLVALGWLQTRRETETAQFSRIIAEDTLRWAEVFLPEA